MGEACDVFTDYIQSLGLKDHATDGQGNQITFKKWGEQLHEAFDALETYDPDKARSILNELLQYQIDADITQNLQNIVANIEGSTESIECYHITNAGFTYDMESGVLYVKSD